MTINKELKMKNENSKLAQRNLHPKVNYKREKGCKRKC